jgi:hypothetical protein
MTEEQEKLPQWRVIENVSHAILEKTLNDISVDYRIHTLFTGIALAGCPTITVVAKRRKTDDEILRGMKKKVRRSQEVNNYQKAVQRREERRGKSKE